MKTKTKATRMIYLELKWMQEHPEYNLPQWYIRLVFDAEYRLNHGDTDGALHDIQQARTARLYMLNVCDGSDRLYVIPARRSGKTAAYKRALELANDLSDTDSSYPLQEGADK